MKSYLSIVSRYLSQHKKKTRLAIISVTISVTLITGIFSMLDALMQFEKLQVMHDYGNYHIAVVNATSEERNVIASRIDVRNSGRWKSMGKGVINGVPCQFGAVDSNFAKNMSIDVIEGSYPEKINEIMLEQWAMERLSSDLAIGSSVLIKISEDIEREVVISGVYNDFGNMKASGVPGVLVAYDLALEAEPHKNGEYLVEFKGGVNVLKAEQEIKSTLGIEDERVVHNEHLLAVIGQSEHKAAVGIYTIGVILFLIVLVAGVVMIYNTFNISVMERIRQFGLLRCVGASRSQIEKMVRREGLFITLVAIPIGLTAGMLMTFTCSAILKFFNSSIFGIMPLFTFSILGIGAGIATAFLTVFIASLLPAKKAGKVSPLNAVTGSKSVRISKDRKKGLLTKVLHVDIAMGINSALVKKKTLILMSCSIAISIVMFFGFQVLVDFIHSSLKTTKPYTPDVSLVSEQGLDSELYKKVSGLEGVKKAYGKMFGYANVTFDETRLTEEYKTAMGGIKVRDDGMFDPPEQSWIISYDKNQLNWAKTDLLYGKLDEDLMNEKNGVIAVHTTLRKGVTSRTAIFEFGDKVYADTPTGTKTLTVVGILRSLPFSDSKLNLTTFIATEKLFTELTGDEALKVIDIQLKGKNQEQTIREIKSIAGDSATFLDSRQKNDEMDKTFMTMAVFIYGFVIVIAFISLLNIVNTMNTSVAAKTRYYGVMRAVGMTGGQLDRMVLAEAAAYSLIGCFAGCVLGILLQRALINNFMTHFKMVWKFPLAQVILIFVLSMLVTAISVISPLKRVKARGIADVVNSL